MTRVKICGLTNEEDAMLAANLGADYLGFNLVKDSKRKVSIKNLKEIISKLPPFVTPVGVFVNEEIIEIQKTVKKTGLKIVQLHGDESLEYITQLSELVQTPIIKAIKISDENALNIIPQYLEKTQYLLLDTFVLDQPGGTGQSFDWELAVKVKDYNKPFFLAGGLTPENVAVAIEKIQPFAVDVASGVERLERRKDYDKMKLFIKKVKGLK